jgi:hypothetical protein
MTNGDTLRRLGIILLLGLFRFFRFKNGELNGLLSPDKVGKQKGRRFMDSVVEALNSF